MTDENNGSELHKHQTLRNAQLDFVLNHRISRIKERLLNDIEVYKQAIRDDAPRGLNPLLQAKLEALAILATLADYHCMISHKAIAHGDHEEAHTWAIDEGRLHGAIEIIASVQLGER